MNRVIHFEMSPSLGRSVSNRLVTAVGRVSPLRAAAGHRTARRGLTRPTRCE